MSDKDKDNKNENLEDNEKFRTEKFENHNELVRKVNKKLIAAEKCINKKIEPYGEFVRLYFDFCNSCYKFSKKDNMPPERIKVLNTKRYMFICEIYNLYYDYDYFKNYFDPYLFDNEEDEEDDENEYDDEKMEKPKGIIEACPYFETEKEYEQYVKVAEESFSHAVSQRYFAYILETDSSHIDRRYDEKYGIKGADIRFKLDRFPNDEDFIKRINDRLKVIETNANDVYDDKKVYCEMFFNFAEPIVEQEPEYLETLTKEERNQLLAPKYTFFAKIYVDEDFIDDKEDKINIMLMQDSRPHNTEEEYEKYIRVFALKVEHEMLRCHMMYRIKANMDDEE